MYVCVDVDGTLVYFNKALKQALKKHNIELDLDSCTKYNYSHLGVETQKKIWDTIRNDVSLYKNLEFFDGVKDSLKRLQYWIRTVGYTGSTFKPEILELRKTLLMELNLSGTPYTTKKPTDLGAFALIDDCLAVHKQWIADGSIAYLFLIDAPYNRDTDEETEKRIIRCKDFNDAVDKLLKLL